MPVRAKERIAKRKVNRHGQFVVLIVRKASESFCEALFLTPTNDGRHCAEYTVQSGGDAIAGAPVRSRKHFRGDAVENLLS